MMAPKTPFDVAREIASPLTPVEKAVFDRCVAAAEKGEPAPTIEELMNEIGASGSATIPGIMKRLEAKGYIQRHIYQRGRKVCIPSLGICTAEPRNTSPHWRTYPRQPAPAIQTLYQREPSVAMTVEARARQKGMSLADYLEQLVRRGLADDIAEENDHD